MSYLTYVAQRKRCDLCKDPCADCRLTHFIQKQVRFVRCFIFSLVSVIYSVCVYLLTSTIGINYFVVITHPFDQLQVRKRSSSSCYDRNILYVFPVFILCLIVYSLYFMLSHTDKTSKYTLTQNTKNSTNVTQRKLA